MGKTYRDAYRFSTDVLVIGGGMGGAWAAKTAAKQVRDVLVVEDILDSGMTLSFLLKSLSARKPSSIRLCTLLDKPERRKVDIYPDYVGAVVPDKFIVGYGLDYAEHYRNLPDVCILSPKMYA